MGISTVQAPWFADFANYLASGILPHGLSSYQKKMFFYDIRSYFWESPSYSSYARMSSTGATSLSRKCRAWFFIVMTLHVEDMLAPLRPLPRCFKRSSFSPLFSRMSTLMSVHVIVAKGWTIGPERMKCLSISSLKLRSLIFGASTLWDPFHPLEATSIYWWLWIMSPSGWRQLLALLTTPGSG